MRDLFVDCRYGIAGDMMLAALIDAGADVEYIVSELRKLPIGEFTMQVVSKNEKGITAKYLELDISDNDVEHHHSHHLAKDILEMIAGSGLPERVKDRSCRLFGEIARAEGKIHGLPAEEVHFHEVGAMDSIIDIIGVCLALEYLDVERLVFTQPAVGYGLMKMAHGLYPIPAPATAEILVGVPLADFTCEGELVTPTGAAFVKILAEQYVVAPKGIIEKIGYGAGTKSFDHPNVIRVLCLKK